MVIDLKAANHTGRELELMLAGTKPLAMFYAYASELPNEDFIPEEAFAPYVGSGQLARQEAEFAGNQDAPVRYVFFALPSETWRINAMILLKQSFEKSTSRWNEALERIQCSLLGYTEEETTAWCRFAPFIKQET